MSEETVYVSWESRLEDLYNMASVGGSTNPEAVLSEWHDWAKSQDGYGRDVELDLEAIPEEEWEAFVDYCESEDQG